MIVSCDNCSASLQIDETKVSSERFNVRCPKCQHTILVNLNSAPPAQDAAAASARSWNSTPAAAYSKKNAAISAPDKSFDKNADLLTLLSNALQQQQNSLSTDSIGNHATQNKRVLICLNNERAEALAQLLDDAGHTVFIAENPAQATEKIRDEEVDVVVYSPDFALKFSGASVVQKMLLSLLSRERRQIFVVSIEEGSQTFSTHEAFMRNLNLIVNVNDLHHFPSILHRALRDYDELYKHFKQAA